MCKAKPRASSSDAGTAQPRSRDVDASPQIVHLFPWAVAHRLRWRRQEVGGRPPWGCPSTAAGSCVEGERLESPAFSSTAICHKMRIMSNDRNASARADPEPVNAVAC
jgi:hypothetical protein